MVAHDRYYDINGRTLKDRRLKRIGEEENVQSVRLVDEWLKIQTEFTLQKPATLWRFPIETVSLSEAGFERLYLSRFPLLEHTTCPAFFRAGRRIPGALGIVCKEIVTGECGPM